MVMWKSESEKELRRKVGVYVGKIVTIRPEPNVISTHTDDYCGVGVGQALCGDYSWPGPTRQRLSFTPDRPWSKAVA
jgi:hypothetical protein